MRSYELMIIIHGGLDEATVTETVDGVTGRVQELGGTVDNVDHWGRREFAYEIRHMTEGYYAVMDLQLPAERAHELERYLNIAERVVRSKLIEPSRRTKQTS
jgi:small subunit ribosomal protein S6